ncbi:MAG: hypothetical protein J0I22_04030 [Stenotrophomonas nitritireducens]|nr:hypothetical protein [Stenotrophomonas nitritireducens]
MEKIGHPAATFPARANGVTFARLRGIACDAAAAHPCAADTPDIGVHP